MEMGCGQKAQKSLGNDASPLWWPAISDTISVIACDLSAFYDLKTGAAAVVPILIITGCLVSWNWGIPTMGKMQAGDRDLKYRLTGIFGVLATLPLIYLMTWSQIELWLACTPLIALATLHASRGALTIPQSRREQKGYVGLAIFIPIMALLIGGDGSPVIMNPVGPFILGFIFSIFLIILFYYGDKNFGVPHYMWIFYFILNWVYADNALAIFSTKLDHSKGAEYRPAVVAKDIRYGSHFTSYHLTLAPWGNISDKTDVTVVPSLFQQAVVGKPVCTILHPGLLGMDWYELFSCS